MILLVLFVLVYAVLCLVSFLPRHCSFDASLYAYVRLIEFKGTVYLKNYEFLFGFYLILSVCFDFCFELTATSVVDLDSPSRGFLIGCVCIFTPRRPNSSNKRDNLALHCS